MQRTRVLRSTFFIGLSIAALATVGCSRNRSAPAEVDATPPTPAAAVSIAPGLDVELTALANAALACPWSDAGLDRSCAGYVSWKQSTLVREPRANELLTSMLGDPREPVRWLAAETLAWYVESVAPLAPLVPSLLDAAKREHSPVVAGRMGEAAAALASPYPAHAESLKYLAREHPLAEMRSGVMVRVDFSRPALEELPFEAARHDPSLAVQEKALVVLGQTMLMDSRFTNRVVALLFEKLAGDEPNMSAEAGRQLLLGVHLETQRVPALEAYAARSAAGKALVPLAMVTMRMFHKRADTPAAQREKVVALLTRWVDTPAPACDGQALCDARTEQHQVTRRESLGLLGEIASDRVAEIAAKYTEDPDPMLRREARFQVAEQKR